MSASCRSISCLPLLLIRLLIHRPLLPPPLLLLLHHPPPPLVPIQLLLSLHLISCRKSRSLYCIKQSTFLYVSLLFCSTSFVCDSFRFGAQNHHVFPLLHTQASQPLYVRFPLYEPIKQSLSKYVPHALSRLLCSGSTASAHHVSFECDLAGCV